MHLIFDLKIATIFYAAFKLTALLLTDVNHSCCKLCYKHLCISQYTLKKIANAGPNQLKILYE